MAFRYCIKVIFKDQMSSQRVLSSLMKAVQPRDVLFSIKSSSGSPEPHLTLSSLCPLYIHVKPLEYSFQFRVLIRTYVMICLEVSAPSIQSMRFFRHGPVGWLNYTCLYNLLPLYIRYFFSFDIHFSLETEGK